MTEERVQEVLRFVSEILECSLNLAAGSISPDENLGAYSRWDSLLALELLTALEEKYGVELNPSSLFDEPTPLHISHIVVECLKPVANCD